MPYDKPNGDGAPGRGSNAGRGSKREGDMWRRYMKDHY